MGLIQVLHRSKKVGQKKLQLSVFLCGSPRADQIP